MSSDLSPDIVTLVSFVIAEYGQCGDNDDVDVLLCLFSCQSYLQELKEHENREAMMGHCFLSTSIDACIDACLVFLEECYLDDYLLAKFSTIRNQVCAVENNRQRLARSVADEEPLPEVHKPISLPRPLPQAVGEEERGRGAEAQEILAAAHAQGEIILQQAQEQAKTFARTELERMVVEAQHRQDAVAEVAAKTAGDILEDAMQRAAALAVTEEQRLGTVAQTKAQNIVAEATRRAEIILQEASAQANALVQSETKRAEQIARQRAQQIETFAVAQAKKLLAVARRKSEEVPASPPPPLPEEAPPPPPGPLSAGLEDSESVPEGLAMNADLIPLFQVVTPLIKLVADRAPTLLKQLEMDYFFQELTGLYPLLEGAEEADRVLSAYLCQYIGKLSAHIRVFPFLQEDVAALLQKADLARERAMSTMDLTDISDNNLCSPINQILLALFDPLLPTNGELKFRIGQEYIPGCISPQSFVALTSAIEFQFNKSSNAEESSRIKRIVFILNSLFCRSDDGSMDQVALLASGLGWNFIHMCWKSILNSDEARRRFGLYLVRRLQDLYSSRPRGTLEKEVAFIVAWLSQSREELKLQLEVTFKMASLCFQPEIGKMLESFDTGEWSTVVFFNADQPSFLGELGLNGGDPTPILRKSMAKSVVDELYALLLTLPPFGRDLCLLQLMHRGVLAWDTLEKILRLMLKDKKTTLQESLPYLAEELLARLRWGTGLAYLK